MQTHDPQLSLFMAVPTIYIKLIQHYDNCNHSDATKGEIKQQCQKLRCCICKVTKTEGGNMRWLGGEGELLGRAVKLKNMVKRGDKE